MTMATGRSCRISAVLLAVLASGVTSNLIAQRDTSALASWDRRGAASGAAADQGGAPGEIIVGVREHCDRSQLEAALASRGMSIVGEIPRLRALKVESGTSRSVAESCESARALAGVEYAEPNGTGRAASADPPDDPPVLPNDTWFHELWQLDNPGILIGKAGCDIEALKAWQIQPDAPEVIIAVLDTGIDYSHPEFADRLLQGFDFVDEDDDATGLEPHGLKVAGIIGARGNNGFGVCGVVPRCKLLPVKVLDAIIGGKVFDLAQGLDYAVSQGARVVNLSVVGYPDAAVLKSALQAAGEAGVVIVAAAGNDGVGTADSNWPAASPYAMSIGGTTASDKLANFSATGTVVDFVAPGRQVVTVNPSHADSDSALFGTSAASPIAAGIAALLLGYDPHLTPDQVYALLQAGAEDQVGNPLEDTPGWDPFYGHGRLNAYRSLQALCSCTANDVLTVSPPKLSIAAGGTWAFRITGGSTNSLQPYLIVGTLSGAGPGFTLGQTPWPLVFDTYTRHCLVGPTPLIGHVGLLDGEGNATATLTLPASARESLAGLTLHHAAAVYDGARAQPYASVPLLLSAPVESGIHKLPVRLFLEDFEGGAPGWVFDNGANGQWHIAPPGECGASSHRAAYNSGASSCSYGNSTSGRLISPSFVLSGLPPYRIRFSSVIGLGPGGGVGGPARLSLVDETSIATLATQHWTASQFGESLHAGTSMHEVTLPESSKFEGRTVHIEAEFTAPDSGTGLGWLLDDVSVWNAAAE